EAGAGWLGSQVKKLGVDIRLETEGKAAAVLDERPDAVIVATGAAPLVPPVPGLAACPYAVSAWDVLLETKPLGQRVIVIDDQGGQESKSAAEFLLDQGRQVEVITPQYCAGEDI